MHLCKLQKDPKYFEKKLCSPLSAQILHCIVSSLCIFISNRWTTCSHIWGSNSLPPLYNTNWGRECLLKKTGKITIDPLFNVPVKLIYTLKFRKQHKLHVTEPKQLHPQKNQLSHTWNFHALNLITIPNRNYCAWLASYHHLYHSIIKSKQKGSPYN